MRNRALDIAVPSAACAFFLAFSWPVLRLLPVAGEEGAVGSAAVRILGLAELPSMYTINHGAGNYYATVPFILLFGREPLALAARGAFFGCAVIAGVFLLASRAAADRRAASLATALAATLPVMLVASGNSALWGLAESALLLFGLALLLRALEGRGVSLFASAGLLGLALACRSTVAGALVGVAAWMLLDSRARQACSHPALRRAAVPAGILLCALQLPFLAGAYRSGALSYWARHRVERAQQGSNAALADSLGQRLDQLRGVLAGEPSFVQWDSPGAAFPHGPWLAAAALVGMLAAARKSAPLGLRLLAALVPAYLISSLFSPTMLRDDQLMPLVPLLCVLAAAAPSAWPRARAGAWAALLTLLLAQGASTAAFARSIGAELADAGSPSSCRLRGAEALARKLDFLAPASVALFAPTGSDWMKRGAEYMSAGRPVFSYTGEDIAGGEGSAAFWDQLFQDGDGRVFAFESYQPYGQDVWARVAEQASRRRLKTVFLGTVGAPGAPCYGLYRFAGGGSRVR